MFLSVHVCVYVSRTHARTLPMHVRAHVCLPNQCTQAELRMNASVLKQVIAEQPNNLPDEIAAKLSIT